MIKITKNHVHMLHCTMYKFLFWNKCIDIKFLQILSLYYSYYYVVFDVPLKIILYYLINNKLFIHMTAMLTLQMCTAKI